MGLVTQTIRTLNAGISQQPPVLRFPEQAETQINLWSTAADGLQKRPPSLHIANLSLGAEWAESKIHWINRDTTERYVSLFRNDGIAVFDLAGNKMVVNLPEGLSYLSDASKDDIKAITVADFTFVLNTKRETKLGTKVFKGSNSNTWCVVCRQGGYALNHSVTIDIDGNKTTVSYQTPDGTGPNQNAAATPEGIITGLITQLNLDPALLERVDILQFGTNFRIVPKSLAYVVNVKATSALGDSALYAFSNSVTNYADLPMDGQFQGWVIKIQPAADSDLGAYWVRWDSGDHQYIECPEPDVIIDFDGSTMPHVLVREADGAFTFRAADWTERLSGGEEDTPAPSFIGLQIREIFFYRNRLGLFADENIILSQSAGFFNFWQQTAVTINDSDPIDVSVSNNQVSILRNAVLYSTMLLPFSDQAQFVFGSNAVLTPQNVQADVATNYTADNRTIPVVAGQVIYFPTTRGKFTTINNYHQIGNVAYQFEAMDATTHAPNLIPSGVYKMASSTTEDLLAVMTEGDRSKLYIYKYLFAEGQQAQASWSIFNFNGGLIYSAEFINSSLFMVIKRADSFYLEKIDFATDYLDFEQEPYRVFLDRKKAIQLTEYNPESDQTIFRVADTGFTDLPPDLYKAVVDTGVLLKPDTNGVFTLRGDYRNKWAFIGIQPEFTYEFSQFFIKQSDANGKLNSVTDGRLQLRYGWLEYGDTGAFSVEIHRRGGKVSNEIFTGKIIGSSNSKLGAGSLETGQFKFPIQGNSLDTTVIIRADNPMPLKLVSAGWLGNFIKKGQAI
ncbi:hypothetical protein [Iodobacter sp.]|uniref:phage nozzle protein n=1 Tax=Iodobacter sp. TaxID=1915058 RepID=UPI0025D0848B|nr:hypothetical protein [Iodobacter sp.]